MDIKRIKFERTGGFAGIRLATDFALNELPADQANQIRGLLNEMHFDELPERIMGKQVIPDAFTYVITVEYDGTQHTVTTSDGAIPEKLQPFLDLLNQIAYQRPRK